MKIFHYLFNFIYLLNSRKTDNKMALFLSFLGVGYCVAMNIFSIYSLLNRYFSLNEYFFVSNFLQWALLLFPFLFFSIYFLVFKRYKITDENVANSPWKKPNIYGGIYFVLSLFICLICIWL